METPICAACGCSLIRLGIPRAKAICHLHKNKQYWFCCEGCLELFKKNPEQLLIETSNLAVCPVCLAEKPVINTMEYKFNDMVFNFCKCPHCLDAFNHDQEYFIKRLTWQTNYSGILGEQDRCCTK